MKLIINTEQEMIKLGKVLSKFYYPNLVICLSGTLGAGKTTFTKGIGEALEIKRIINSPTFTIMKIYDETNHLNGINALYHLDVYRLTDASSDFDLEEYFNLDGLAVIEWADIIDKILPESCWKMIIDIDPVTSKRIIDLKLLDNTNESDVRKELIDNGYEIIS